MLALYLTAIKVKGMCLLDGKETLSIPSVTVAEVGNLAFDILEKKRIQTPKSPNTRKAYTALWMGKLHTIGFVDKDENSHLRLPYSLTAKGIEYIRKRLLPEGLLKALVSHDTEEIKRRAKSESELDRWIEDIIAAIQLRDLLAKYRFVWREEDAK